ncbi:MAG: hypothetical protein ACR2K0_08005 [Acidimicrobiales bacterium]
MTQVTTRIARQPFLLDASDVGARALEVLPEPLVDHYVVVEGRRYPPKQVIALVTGLDRADFTTHQARGVLRRLGFTVGRRQAELPIPAAAAGPHGGAEAKALAPFVGRWVAQKGIEVMVAADTPEEVLAWLERHDQHADGMFRVPRQEWEMEGWSSNVG